MHADLLDQHNDRSCLAMFTIWKWKGRYSKVKKFNRNCKVCNKGLIEDEVHFL